MAQPLRLKAYGKVNLGLDVIRRREDGYHEVRMIVQTVKLYDRIILERNHSGNISLRTNLPYLPVNEKILFTAPLISYAGSMASRTGSAQIS